MHALEDPKSRLKTPTFATCLLVWVAMSSPFPPNMMTALLQAAEARRQEGLVHTVVPGVQQIQNETLSLLCVYENL
jgi:hypothetical protein